MDILTIDTLAINTHHQNILSSVNLQACLRVGLGINVNLAFKGSKCTVEEKLASQHRLLQLLEHILALTLGFIFHNTKNQAHFYDQFEVLKGLCELELDVGNDVNEASARRVRTSAKKVIIELIRANEDACNKVRVSDIAPL